jgi:hypothetical protein
MYWTLSYRSPLAFTRCPFEKRTVSRVSATVHDYWSPRTLGCGLDPNYDCSLRSEPSDDLPRRATGSRLSVPDQKEIPVQRPTARWLLQRFHRIHLLLGEGGKVVLDMRERHIRISDVLRHRYENV